MKQFKNSLYLQDPKALQCEFKKHRNLKLVGLLPVNQVC